MACKYCTGITDGDKLFLKSLRINLFTVGSLVRRLYKMNIHFQALLPPLFAPCLRDPTNNNSTLL